MMCHFTQKCRNSLVYIFILFLPHFIYSYLFKTPFGSDFSSSHSLLSRFLYYWRSGPFPLWSPLMHGGMPMTFELALTGGLSPVYWLVYSKFPAAYGGDSITLFLHFKLFVLGVGGVSAFIFFKKLSASSWGAFLAALTFMFNMRMLDNFRYSSPLDILCWLPLLFLALEKTMKSPNLWYGVFYSLSLGIMLLSGHLQHGIFNFLILSVYFFSRIFWISRPGSAKKTGFLIFKVFTFSLLGMAIAAPLLLPLCMDAIGQLGQRASQAKAWTDSYGMSFPTLLANFGFPLFGDVHSSFYSSMASTILLLLAFGSLMGKQIPAGENRKKFIFFGVFFIFCVLYSLGSKAWVSTLVNHCIPVLKFTRGPGRIMGAGVFCLSALTALLVSWIEDTSSAQNNTAVFLKKSLAGIFIFLVLAWTAAAYFKNIPASGLLDPYAPAVIRGSVGLAQAQLQWAVLFGVLGSLGIYCLLGKNRLLFTAGCLLLASLILAEARVYHPQATWYEPKEKILSYDVFTSLDTFHGRLPALQPSGQKWPVDAAKKEAQIDAPKALGEFLLAGGPAAAELYASIGKEPLFFSDTYLVVDDLAQQLKILGPRADLRTTTLIDKKDAQDLASKPLPAEPRRTGSDAKFEVLERTTDKIRFTADVPEDGVINYLNNYHTAFKAVLDGKPKKILRTYGAFKGILVAGGKHEITFYYDPFSFKLGLTLFGAACAALLSLGLFQFQKRPKILP